MKKRIVIFFLVIIVFQGFGQVDAEKIPYFLEIVDIQHTKKLELNEYSLVHNMYMFLFYQFELTERLSPDDKAFILTQLLENFKKGQQVNFVLNNYRDEDKLFVKFEILDQDKKQALLMRSNYQIKTKEFVSPGELTGDWNNFFAIFFNWEQGRLVKEDHRYKKDLEQSYRDKKDWLSLADLYLFDEKSDNDDKVKELLQKNLDQKTELEEKFLTRVTMCESALMNGNIDEAVRNLTVATEMVKDNPSLSGYRKVLAVVSQETELLKAITNQKVN
ncbi:MAG: hypothetical protein JXR70_08915 [Spirochaetales bacterium]|nr:hypothetical protein [Spirochaetales bacterium]